jgi:hypothetical protein
VAGRESSPPEDWIKPMQSGEERRGESGELPNLVNCQNIPVCNYNRSLHSKHLTFFFLFEYHDKHTKTVWKNANSLEHVLYKNILHMPYCHVHKNNC